MMEICLREIRVGEMDVGRELECNEMVVLMADLFSSSPDLLVGKERFAAFLLEGLTRSG